VQSDLILELHEQCFHLLSLPLCLPELGRARQLPCALSCPLMDVNGEIPGSRFDRRQFVVDHRFFNLLSRLDKISRSWDCY
jgi:hypothetical protein